MFGGFPPRVNQRDLFLSAAVKFIFRVSPCSPSTRHVKLYLIKMLCSLPNSSPHIWFSLSVFCGWAMTSIQLNQALLKRETIWVTFLHVVWYDKAAAGPARNVSSQRATQKTLLCLLVIRIYTLASRAADERGLGSRRYNGLFVNSTVTSRYH